MKRFANRSEKALQNYVEECFNAPKKKNRNSEMLMSVRKERMAPEMKAKRRKQGRGCHKKETTLMKISMKIKLPQLPFTI